ncbi:HU family DNA-binding protein [Litorivita sp. NS0012-18]|uniref:HU family DNA-binding protein n=1 Tax=Litorivita sp. NS0012-18 TaxID=3127655 RepID=UPI00310A678E
MAKAPSTRKSSTAKKSPAAKKAPAARSAATKKAAQVSASAADTKPAAAPAPKNPALAAMSTTGILRPDTPEAAKPKPVLVTDSGPTVALAALQKKELLEAVVARSGVKKKDAKPVVEAMMAVMGEALGEGREWELQPLGKFKINRIKDSGNGRVIIGRLRRSAGGQNTARGDTSDSDD